jgi:hypothetical protein
MNLYKESQKCIISYYDGTKYAVGSPDDIPEMEGPSSEICRTLDKF